MGGLTIYFLKFFNILSARGKIMIIFCEILGYLFAICTKPGHQVQSSRMKEVTSGLYVLIINSPLEKVR